jgi:hypothetical protein
MALNPKTEILNWWSLETYNVCSIELNFRAYINNFDIILIHTYNEVFLVAAKLPYISYFEQGTINNQKIHS